MSIKPIIEYARTRLAHYEKYQPNSPRESSAREAAMEELRLIIVLGEGMLSQEALLLKALPHLPHLNYFSE